MIDIRQMKGKCKEGRRDGRTDAICSDGSRDRRKEKWRQMKGRTDGWIDAFGRTDCEQVAQGQYVVSDTRCPA